MSNDHVHPIFASILKDFHKDLEIETDFWLKPIPLRNFDWVATLSSYDGAPDAGWQPVGYGETEAAAIADLKQQIEDHEDITP